MEMFGVLLLGALIVADIVRMFIANEEFDGFMLFARPIVVFIGALLCGEPFGKAILWAVGWGLVGLIFSLVSEHSHRSDDSSSSFDTDVTHTKPAQPKAADRPVNTPKKTQPSKPSSPHSKTQPSKASTPSPAKQLSGSFEFYINILSKQDDRFNKARASNGNVYCRFTSGEKIIGHYELVDSGTRVNIYRTFDRGLIGYAVGGEIYISRKAQYDYECKVRDENGYSYPIRLPVPMEKNLAEIRNGAIKDNRSYECLGSYEGNEYAAAAAFVCLIYHCHEEYEHHMFFKNWDK